MFDFDSMSPAQLRRRSPLKWGRYDEDTLALWVAEMDFPTAPVIMEALERAVKDQCFGYPGSLAEPAEAFSEFWQRRTGQAINPAWVNPVPDVLTGVTLAIGAFSDPQSPVVVPSPVYPPLLKIPHEDTHREVIPIELIEDADWTLDLTAIEQALESGARTVLLCQPHNPTGRIYSQSELRALAEVVDRYAAVVISDEIHGPITRHGQQPVPYASVSEVAASHAITVTSATKSFSVPGLPFSVTAFHTKENQRRWTASVTHQSVQGVSSLGVVASIAAFRHGDEWLDEMRTYLDGNMRLLSDYLADHAPQIPFSIPAATYLAWLDVRSLDLPEEAGHWFVKHAKVALNPGPTFGIGGDGFVRMNLATSRAILSEALERMTKALEQRH